ncbi:MAG: threonine transporter [Porticoccaceae bacterium]|nr:threonine transporter [Porticoccaceae bacterium]
MMVTELAGLGIAMALLAAMPSTSVALVITRSATLGAGHGVAVAMGIVAADVLFAVVAILGLSALLAGLGPLFFWVKLVAGAYLVWFGWSLLRAPARQGVEASGPVSRSWMGSGLLGFMVTLGDVKAIAFYASLFPAFFDIAALSYWDLPGVVLVIVFAVGGVKVLYAFGARALVQRGPAFPLGGFVRRAAGMLMIGAGVYLAIVSNPR